LEQEVKQLTEPITNVKIRSVVVDPIGILKKEGIVGYAEIKNAYPYSIKLYPRMEYSNSVNVYGNLPNIYEYEIKPKHKATVILIIWQEPIKEQS